LDKDIDPIIDLAARDRIAAYVEARQDQIIHQLTAPEMGTFFPPTVLRVNGTEDMPEEIFGPVLHVATFRAGEIDAVIAAINASGYGLTFGMHTRISSRVKTVSEAVHAGNIYINRNQIGAVVGSQPFGGEGLSGTGPKAGGPRYLTRFATGCAPLKTEDMALPGPTGESNVLSVVGRGPLLCMGPTEADMAAQRDMACMVGVDAIPLTGDVDMLETLTGFAAVAYFETSGSAVTSIRRALSRRSGPILPLITDASQLDRLINERHVCIDTTAAGGNASLLSSSA
jgi:RHH-type proline utilization regulon transcriptional repressor/proline dehydrogenase/delta 1-pyrroline-5-carboxylate dehydrogenase